MAHVILDLQIAAAAKGVNKKLLEDNKIIPRDVVFKKHNIDSVLFAKNNNYYAFHLEAYNKIYGIVKDSLKSLKREAEKNNLLKVEAQKELKNQNIKKLKNDNKVIEAFNKDKKNKKRRRLDVGS